tara:strand:+ start:4700 stop:5500 length:801 start_codon:yes stop_codon:yes gene_type:complete
MNLTQDSYPYLTGMGLRNRCHMVFDEFHKDEADKIKHDGQVIFIKTDLVPMFFTRIMPRINRSVVIITHNSALGIGERYKKYLDDPRVIKWYAQNANFNHPKLCSVPLGIANARWPHGDISEIKKANEAKNKKDHLVYMNFDLKTNITERTKVYDMFKDKDYVLKGERKPFGEYLKDLARCKYTLSPPGAGIDCHRIWESVAVGTVPIVQDCHNISFHKDMPIMIIDDWGKLTEEYLSNKYDNFTSNKYSSRAIMIDYWSKKIGLL